LPQENFLIQKGRYGKKMKHAKFFAILAGISLIGSGFTAETFASDAKISAKNGSSAIVHEYGEPNAILDSEGMFCSVLRYPRTGIEAIDKAIYEWASVVYNSIKKEAFSGGGQKEPYETEIDVDYSTFKIKGDYAGIEEIGSLSGSFLAHPADIVKTFNVDIKGKKLLTQDEMLNHNIKGALDLLRKKIAKLYPDMKDALDEVDETWLAYLVLKPNGIDVLLPRGEYLPSVLGLQRFTLTYEELGGFLKGR
jgi:hypothetical protein